METETERMETNTETKIKVEPKLIWALSVGILGFVLIILLLGEHVSWEIKATLAITYLGIVLWITEIISFGLTSILILVLYLFFQTATIDLALSGFASGAVFLITGGMMMAQGVHSTVLGHRIIFYILKRVGNNAGALLFGIIAIPQILAVFIPATGVRTSLILPTVLSLITILHLQEKTNYKKQMMLAVAYGGNVSGIGFLPAAIGNVLVVEIIYIYLGQTISYFDWFIYTFPIWLLSIPVTWYVVYKAFPIDVPSLGTLGDELNVKIKELGKLSKQEKKCIAILSLTVLLWATQAFHGLHPAVPTLFAVVLMGLPHIGITSWDKLSKIDVNTMLLVGSTLSIGRVLNETGSIQYLTAMMFSDWFLEALMNPLLAVFLLVVIVQVFHLGVSNVSTAVVTIVPVVIGLAMQIQVDPTVFAIVAGVASLLGFILVVETIPNVLAHSTGHIAQKDFFKPGIILTILTTMIIVLVAGTWWKWLGLY